MVIDALKKVVKTNIASDHILTKIYISSANDQHQTPSRHVQGNGKAVDISRINGMKMSAFYPSNPAVKAIAMQAEFETYLHRRENFGPSFKKKLGNNHAISLSTRGCNEDVIFFDHDYDCFVQPYSC